MSLSSSCTRPTQASTCFAYRRPARPPGDPGSTRTGEDSLSCSPHSPTASAYRRAPPGRAGGERRRTFRR
ncbi:endoprotease [Gallid alphaherpesvirus 3]|uniref:Endoprotease n=1 Tax=Gallid alphaherpesvirus 3 TaxID=35250 RepID=F8TC97_9ALPH|nr:endoprotease [Gallid alphaherpesvirus 3]YP_010795699.1 endoprotease [Gallid alphaherpesvirus 3]AEI00284.1 endoprotease [Gallid alphaherpesvirus 3]AEI00308.1 endoprotease [Gallid alphaherpesvirus 3]QEY02324.1 endoprotease [Gallid alphaherpesvirus 3]QEY02325.1 endoprotease [Gallid alphaherpesvirus 3]